jgi:hypothetical protein
VVDFPAEGSFHKKWIVFPKTLLCLVGRFKSLKLAGLASDLADWPSLVCGLSLLEPRLMESPTTGIIPFYDRVIFVCLLNCAEFPSRLSEVAQTLDAISGLQVLDVWRWLGEAWLLGTV